MIETNGVVPQRKKSCICMPTCIIRCKKALNYSNSSNQKGVVNINSINEHSMGRFE